MIEEALVQQLNHGETLISPSRRLASRLKQDYQRIVATQNPHQQVWVTPKIFALDDWLLTLWEQLEIQGKTNLLLLTQTQSLLCLEKIILCASTDKPLIKPFEAAKTAYQALDLIHAWQVPGLLGGSDNPDHQAFSHWAAEYHQTLQKNNYTDRIAYKEFILDFLVKSANNTANNILSEPAIILYGFEELSPYLAYFFETLQENYIRVTKVSPPEIKAEKQIRYAFAHQEQEWRQAAQWAREHMQNKAKAAVVVLDLAKERYTIEHIFRTIFEPLAVCQPQHSVSKFYNISAAIPLIQYPIIQSVFECLQCALSGYNLADYTACLLSPFTLEAQADLIAYAQHAATLQKMNQNMNQNTPGLFYALDPACPPEWLQKMQSVEEARKTWPSLGSYAQWQTLFRKILALFGWPGARTLNSVEYQAVNRFDALLNEMQAFDSVLPPSEAKQAFLLIQKIASNTPFQPQDQGAPVQILGLLEAMGQTFDHLWVSGLDSDAWPPAAKANPFIPIDVQRRLKMPHASAERELAFAQLATARLKNSAQEVIFSYATQNRQTLRQASELIREVPLEALPEEKRQMWDALEPLESIQDSQGLVFDPEKNSVNAYRLALQAECPFKSYAQGRLGAHTDIVKLEQSWFDPKTQGNIVHEIVEKLFKHWNTQQRLLAESEQAINERLKNEIDCVMKRYITAHMPEPYLIVEKARLKKIVLNYLALEKQRPPYTVCVTEQAAEVQIEGLNVRLRIDRLDRDSQGHLMILDYKTGQFKLQDLFSVPLKAPQLPLYFLALKSNQPAAVFAARIAIQGAEYIGLSNHNVTLTGLKNYEDFQQKMASECPPTWAALADYWEAKLRPLAQDLLRGQALINPIEGVLTCQYCDLASLCRVKEITSL